jgi:hypothetical protein
MRFFNSGTINPGQVFRRQFNVVTSSNPQGDWGLAYIQAHPRRETELVCDFHGKLLQGGLFFYAVDIINRGPNQTIFDIDVGIL